MARSITSANAQFTLNVPGVSPVPVPIEGFATDDAFDTEPVTPNETLMGVDGNLSGGRTPYPTKLKFVLQADSASIDFMELWRATEQQVDDNFQASASIVSPALGKIWTFTKGFLTSALPTPPGKKVFQPQNYEITFESCTTAPV